MNVRKQETQFVISLCVSLILAAITKAVGGQAQFLICGYAYYICSIRSIVPKVIAIVVEHTNLECKDVLETLSAVSAMLFIFLMSTIHLFTVSPMLILLVSFILFTLTILPLIYINHQARKK